MTKRHRLIRGFYNQLILKYPGFVILFILAVVLFLGYQAKDFKLDASAETLLLETDEDLRYSRVIKSRYGGYDYLVMTYTPKEDLFSERSLADLIRLRDELRQLQSVSSVVSILDVPLLESPPVPVKELIDHIQTLESPTVDRKLARLEFKNSPLYRNLLISPDLNTTALQINFWTDKVYQDLILRRDRLLTAGIVRPRAPPPPSVLGASHLLTTPPGSSNMEEDRRNRYGDTECEECSGGPLPEAPESRQTRAPIGVAGGHPHPESCHRIGTTRLDPRAQGAR